MIAFLFHPTPNPAKVALISRTSFGLPAYPIDTSKGEQHTPAFRDHQIQTARSGHRRPKGQRAEARVFDFQRDPALSR